MRITEDHLERLGIARTKHVLTDSQLVLLVADFDLWLAKRRRRNNSRHRK